MGQWEDAGAEQEDGIDRLCQSRSGRSEESKFEMIRIRMPHILKLLRSIICLYETYHNIKLIYLIYIINNNY